MPSASERTRLSIDMPGETRRRIRLAAARRDQPVRQYVLEAVEARLRDDLTEDASAGLLTLSESADPVLAELWDNPADATYDTL